MPCIYVYIVHFLNSSVAFAPSALFSIPVHIFVFVGQVLVRATPHPCHQMHHCRVWSAEPPRGRVPNRDTGYHGHVDPGNGHKPAQGVPVKTGPEIEDE